MLRARGLAAILRSHRNLEVAESASGLAAAAGWQRSSWAPSECSLLGSIAAPSEPIGAEAACGLRSTAPWAGWRQLHTSAASAAAAELPPAASGEQQEQAPAKQVLYRGRGMQLFRVLVRLKVFQLAGIAALAVPINTFLATGDVSGTQAVMATALVVGAGAASTALWYYSRRYVGELSLLPGKAPGEPPRVRLSVLDFWGNREDNDVPLSRLVAPLAELPQQAQRAALADPLLPLDVEGDRQYFLSVRYGRVLDPAVLQALLTGRLQGQGMQADAEEGEAAAGAPKAEGGLGGGRTGGSGSSGGEGSRK